MKQEFLIHKGTQSLALVFTGWATSPTLFRGISLDCDLMVAWDYSDFTFDESCLKEYKNIYLFAWSFGIVGATAMMNSNHELPIVLKCAINGSQFPVDDTKGIPTHIFQGTKQSLSERNLTKFYNRMCGSRQQFAELIEKVDAPDIQSLVAQLESVEQAELQPIIWDKVYLAKCDRIFPFENCLTAWADHCSQVVIDDNGAHTPADFGNIIASNIINKDLIRERFSRSFEGGYDKEASVQGVIANNLFELWKATAQAGCEKSILEVGCGTGMFTRLYLPELYPHHLVLNDLCREPSVVVNLNATDYRFIQGDAEQLEFDAAEQFDYVLSTSAIQWFENLERFFDKASRWLNPKGLLVLSTFGADNLKEVCNLTGTTLNYKSLDWLRNALSEHFDVLALKSENITLDFASALDVFRHIKTTGVNSIGRQSLPPAKLKQVINNYPCDGGTYPLTYNPIYIIARKR